MERPQRVAMGAALALPHVAMLHAAALCAAGGPQAPQEAALASAFSAALPSRQFGERSSVSREIDFEKTKQKKQKMI